MEKKVRSTLHEEFTCQECLNCDARFERSKSKVTFACKLTGTSDYRKAKLKNGDLLPGCEHYIDDQTSFLHRRHW